ncbi:MAG: NADH-quinone oxidoreductase subunit A [Chloroflexi bacterium]|nr:NADH-quinone oxidoreductase subunit A [Chloroflexota bacterium]
MQANYGYIALFVLAAILFALVMVLTPTMLRLIGIIPQKPNPTKTSIYECGMETVGNTWVQFNFRYYFYALIFVALDVLALFIYPWAVDLRKLGMVAFIAIFIFILIIAVGWVYAWKKKVLEWK